MLTIVRKHEAAHALHEPESAFRKSYISDSLMLELKFSGTSININIFAKRKHRLNGILKKTCSFVEFGKKKKMLFQQELDSGQGTCDKKRRCG